ncbi:NAD(P)/FAD-dependent oxidoreductase [Candidatus Bodocaedibacter vickermanii]|uniref:Ferredoxin--NADP reductase n=1 Tax=Candidatus Bodocaedibacter vickermanii TaxID=2741701 RepID=A0A7L9RTG1_9PROT|nr:Ferredoxin--NADP reductase [Candidatus Paracaedibacteraceae bacterium 'Lake Konstanz']
MIHTDVVIIGAGPAGLFSIFQCGMMGLKTHVVDALDFIGGQCTALYPEKPIYDIPAYPAVSAEGLIEQLRLQAEPFNPVYHLSQSVVSIEPIDTQWQVTTNKGTVIQAKGIIIAAGAGAFGPNRPPLDDIQSFEGTSVFYAVHQRQRFAGKHIVIAGGGDSAVDWAISLSEIAASISMVHRRANFRAAPESVSRMNALVDEGKITLVTPYQLSGLKGDNGQLTDVIVETLDGQLKTLTADVLLPFFGLQMDLGPLADWGLNIDNKHITVAPHTMETNLSGIFAVGDISTYPGKLKLILCGFSEVAMAAHTLRSRLFPETVFHFEYSTTKGIPPL